MNTRGLNKLFEKQSFGAEDQGFSVQSQKQIGGESLLLEHQQKGASKGKGRDHRRGKGATDLGDCVHGTKGQCAKGDSCSLKQEPIKRPQSKGRWSIHRRPRFQDEYKGGGKGKAPRISGTTPSGKKDEPHASISKEGSD